MSEDLLDPQITQWLMENEFKVQGRKDEILARKGEATYQELLGEARKMDETRQTEWMSFGAMRQRLIPQFGDTPEGHLRALKESLKSVKDPAVKAKISEEITPDLLAADAYEHLEAKFGMLFGNPREYAKELEGGIGTAVSPELRGASEELNSFSKFAARFKESLKAEQPTPGESPGNRAVRAAETGTKLGTGLAIMAQDRQRTLRELGMVKPMEMKRFSLERRLSKYPEIAELVSKDSKPFSEYSYAVDLYLNIAANRENLAQEAVKAGTAPDMADARHGIQDWLKRAYTGLADAKKRLPETRSKRDLVGAYTDPFDLPPSPQEPGEAFAGFIQGVARGFGDLYGGLADKMLHADTTNIRGKIALGAPVPYGAPADDGLFHFNLSPGTLGELTGEVVGILPMFELAAASGIPRVLAGAAGKATEAIPGIGKLAAKLVRPGVTFGSEVGIAEALSPKEQPLAERLKSSGTAAVAAGALGTKLGAAGVVLKGAAKGTGKIVEAIARRRGPQAVLEKAAPVIEPIGTTTPSLTSTVAVEAPAKVDVIEIGGDELAKPLERSISRVGFNAAVIPNPGSPPKVREIISDMSEAAGFSIRTQRQRSRRIGGTYIPSTGNVSIAQSGNIGTAAHEVAHRLDDTFKIVGEHTGPGQFKFNITPSQQSELASPIFGQTVAKGADPIIENAERFAEFFHLWSINPAKARTLAPEMVALLESRLGPESVAKWASIQEKIGRLAGTDPLRRISAIKVKPSDLETTWLDNLKGNLAKTPEDQMKMSFLDSFLTATQNMMRPATIVAKRIVQKITGHKVSALNDPETLYAVHLGHNAVVEDFFKNGIRDRDKARVVDSVSGEAMNASWLLKPFYESGARSPAQVEQMMDLTENYLIAIRGLEKTAQTGKEEVIGFTGGLQSEVIESTKAVMQAQRNDPMSFDIIKEAARRYRLIADQSLKNAVASGRLSQAEYKIIKSRNQEYVTFQRLMETSPGEAIYNAGDFARSPGRRVGSPTGILKPFKGVTRPIINPYTTLYEGIGKMQQEITRNEFMRSLTDLVMGKARNLYEGDVVDLAQIGRRVEEGEKDAFRIWRNGKAEHWKFDPVISESLKAVDAIDKSWAALSLPSKILSASIVNMPAFVARNFIRDVGSTYVRTSAGKGGGLLSWLPEKPFRAFKPLTEERISDFKAYGGANSGWYMRDKLSWEKALDAQVRSDLGKKANILLNPIEFAKTNWLKWEGILEKSELTNRVAEFERVTQKYLKQGFTLEEAKLHGIREARGLMDFALVGSHMNFLKRTVPFLNPSIQASYSFAKALKERPIVTATRLTLGATALHESQRYWNKAVGAEDLWTELPDYRKDLFANYYVGDGRWLMIPTGYELGFFASLLRRSYEDRVMGWKDAWKGTGPSSLKAFLPVEDITGITPTFLSVPTQVVTDYDIFRDAPIVGYEKEKAPEKRKYRDNASALGIALDRTLGKFTKNFRLDDPRQWDFILRSQFGTMGSRAMELSDLLAGREDRPKLTIGKLSGLGGTTPTKGSSVTSLLKEAKRQGIDSKKQITNIKDKLDEIYKLEEGSLRREVRLRALNKEARRLLEAISKE